MKWSDVERTNDYLLATNEQKQLLRDRYWDDYVVSSDAFEQVSADPAFDQGELYYGLYGNTREGFVHDAQVAQEDLKKDTDIYAQFMADPEKYRQSMFEYELDKAALDETPELLRNIKASIQSNVGGLWRMGEDVASMFGYDDLEKNTMASRMMASAMVMTVKKTGDEKGVVGLYKEGRYTEAANLAMRNAMLSAPISTFLMLMHLSKKPILMAVGYGLMGLSVYGQKLESLEPEMIEGELSRGAARGIAFTNAISEVGSEFAGNIVSMGLMKGTLGITEKILMKKVGATAVKRAATKLCKISLSLGYESSIEGVEEVLNVYTSEISEGLIRGEPIEESIQKASNQALEVFVNGVLSAGIMEAPIRTGLSSVQIKNAVSEIKNEYTEKTMNEVYARTDTPEQSELRGKVFNVQTETLHFDKTITDTENKLTHLSNMVQTKSDPQGQVKYLNDVMGEAEILQQKVNEARKNFESEEVMGELNEKERNQVAATLDRFQKRVNGLQENIISLIPGVAKQARKTEAPVEIPATEVPIEEEVIEKGGDQEAVEEVVKEEEITGESPVYQALKLQSERMDQFETLSEQYDKLEAGEEKDKVLSEMIMAKKEFDDDQGKIQKVWVENYENIANENPEQAQKTDVEINNLSDYGNIMSSKIKERTQKAAEPEIIKEEEVVVEPPAEEEQIEPAEKVEKPEEIIEEKPEPVIEKKEPVKPLEEPAPDILSKMSEEQLNTKKKTLEQSRDSVDKILSSYHEERTLFDEIEDELGLSINILSLKHLHKLKKKEFTPEQLKQVREIEKNIPLSQDELVELRKSRKAAFQADIDKIDKMLSQRTDNVEERRQSKRRARFGKVVKSKKVNRVGEEFSLGLELVNHYEVPVGNTGKFVTKYVFLGDDGNIYASENDLTKKVPTRTLGSDPESFYGEKIYATGKYKDSITGNVEFADTYDQDNKILKMTGVAVNKINIEKIDRTEEALPEFEEGYTPTEEFMQKQRRRDTELTPSNIVDRLTKNEKADWENTKSLLKAIDQESSENLKSAAQNLIGLKKNIGLPKAAQRMVEAFKKEIKKVVSSKTIKELKSEWESGKNSNDQQLTDRLLSAYLEAIKPAVAKVEVPVKQEIVQEEDDGEIERAEVFMVPVNKISVDRKRFQPRKGAYSKKTVDDIINSYDVNKVQPIMLFKDSDGKTYVIAGHSRLEAFIRMGKGKIEAKYFQGTVKAAQDFGKIWSNSMGDPSKDTENAKSLRQKREDGMSDAEVKKMAVSAFGKNANYILALSYLNPDGTLMNAVEMLEGVTDKDAQNTITKIASWVGYVREKLSDELTDNHETELYLYLKNKKNRDDMGTKERFYQKIGSIATDMFFKKNEAININKIITKTDGEKYYNNELNELKQMIQELDDQIAEQKELRAGTEDKKKIEEYDKKIADIKAIRTVRYQEKAKLIARKNELMQTGLNDPNLFDAFDKIEQGEEISPEYTGTTEQKTVVDQQVTQATKHAIQQKPNSRRWYEDAVDDYITRNYAGDANKQARQELMTALRGQEKKVPINQSGITALKAELLKHMPDWETFAGENNISYREISLSEQAMEKVRKQYNRLELDQRRRVKANIVMILDKILGKGNYSLAFVNQIAGHPDALGRHYNRVVEILDGTPQMTYTAYHEAVHFLMENCLTAKQRNSLRGLARQKYGDLSVRELDELLAEDFIDYAKTPVEERQNSSLSDKIKKVFDQIIEYAKKMFIGNNSAYKNIINFYQDAFSGTLSRLGRYSDSIMELEGQAQAFRIQENRTNRAIESQMKDVKEVTDKQGNLLAPNGKVSNLNNLQWRQVRTPAFKDWFGDWQNNPDKASKVVDENGEPMVVYHGTNADFTEFDKVGKRLPALGLGYYFSTNKQKAERYGDNIIPTFISSKSTLNWQNLLAGQRNKIIDTLMKVVPAERIAGFGEINRKVFPKTEEGKKLALSFLRKKEKDTINYYHERAKAMLQLDGNGNIEIVWMSPNLKGASSHNLLALSQEYYNQIASELGYDGVKYGNEIAVFNPTQIKSATANIGTFDSSNPDIRYREITDDNYQKQDSDLSKALRNAELDRERDLPYIMNAIYGHHDRTLLSEPEMDNLIDTIKTYEEVSDNTLDKLRRTRQRIISGKVHNATLEEYAGESGKDKPQLPVKSKVRVGGKLDAEVQEYADEQRAAFQKKARERATFSNPVITWVLANLGNQHIDLAASTNKVVNKGLKKMEFFENYLDIIKALTPDQVQGIVDHFNNMNAPFPASIQDSIEADIIIRAIKELDQLKAHQGKVDIPAALRLINDFHHNINFIAQQSGNYRIKELGDRLINNKIEYQNKVNIDIDGFIEKHRETLNNMSAVQSKALLTWAEDGRIHDSLKNSPAITKLMEDYNKIREIDKSIIRYWRVYQYFMGILKEHHFTKEQRESLHSWEAQYRTAFEKNNQKWKDFVKRIRDGSEPGANDFIKDSYVALDQQALSEIQLKDLDEDMLFSDDKDNLDVGYGMLKTRNTLRRSGATNAVKQLFYAHRKSLRIEYLAFTPENLRLELKGVLSDKSYKMVREQLDRIVDRGVKDSDFVKAIKLAMGRIYMASVVGKGLVQLKNIPQRLLNAETIAQQLAGLKSLFMSNSKYKRWLGDPMFERILEEYGQKRGFNYLAAAMMNEDIQRIKSFDNLKTNKSFMAFGIANFFANPVFELVNNSWGSLLLDIHYKLDLANRLSVLYQLISQAEKTFSDPNVTWDTVMDQMGFKTLDKADRLFLADVYSKQGLSEMVFQLSKIKSIESQFQYDPSLKSIYATTGNIFVKQAIQYSTWWASYIRKVRSQLICATQKGDTKAALRAIAFVTINGMLVKMFLEAITGTLPIVPGDEDDEDYLYKRMLYSALGFFNPTDWTGAWNASTLVPLISPFKIKAFLQGDTYESLQADDLVVGQFGSVVLDMANAAICTYWIMTGDEELRKKATAKLGYLADKVGEQIFVPVEMVERGLSIAQGNRKTNVTRTLITMWGGDNYNPKKADRDFYEKFQYGLFGKNARYIKDDSKKPIVVKNVKL